MLCGWLYSKPLYRRGVRLNERLRTRDLPLIPLALLLFIAVLASASLATRHPGWTWALPLWLDYYYRPIFWLMKLTFVTFPLSAIAFLAFLQRTPQWWLVLVVAVVTVIAVEAQMRVIHRPYLGEIKELYTPEGIVKQSNGATCAAASCANIARLFGLDVNEADMIRVLNTTWEGTSPAQMVYGLRSLGLGAQKTTSYECSIEDIRPPAVLLVDVGGEPDAHAVAYVGVVDNGFEIWDPNVGRLVKSSGDLHDNWRGHAIEVSSPEHRRSGQAPADTPPV